MFPPLELQPKYTTDDCRIRLRAGPYRPQGLLGILEVDLVASPADPDGKRCAGTGVG